MAAVECREGVWRCRLWVPVHRMIQLVAPMDSNVVAPIGVVNLHSAALGLGQRFIFHYSRNASWSTRCVLCH